MAGKTILIVEDSPVSLKLTAWALRGEGYRVEVASTAEQAWSSLRTVKPDLVLVDLRLPGMNGLELTKRIKQDERLQDVIVLALTASGMDSDEEQARQAGCDGYLAKPFDKEKLAVVHQYLEGGSQTALPPPEAAQPPIPGAEASQQPFALAIPESEMEDLRRIFVADGVVKSRQLLATLDQAFDRERAVMLAHQWVGTGAILGFQKIADIAREVEVMLLTPPVTAAQARVALSKLASGFAGPAAAMGELRIPESIVQGLEGKRVALVGLADTEAERLCGALEGVWAKPRLFDAAYPPDSEAIRECNVVLMHVRPETMESKWLAAEIDPSPKGPPVIFIGERERLFALNPDVQARARDFLIDGWQPEEALMRVSFVLARAATPAPAAPVKAGAAKKGAPTPQDTAPAPPEVLIADDDILVRKLVHSTLQNFGMQCRVAASGPEALQEIRANRPQAAVLDVNMPGMNGFEVLAAVRAEKIPVRIILLTARQQDQDVLQGFALGADDYVVKPFSPMELVARLKRLLAAH